MTDGSTSQITNTHYSEGFQYTEDHLDFFPHAEGYVNVIDYSAFHYVYTYKDHLGNIRLKYTLDPDTNETAILEENHYYPYGLTHQGYNADHKFFFAIDEIIELVEVTSIMDDKYKYKFNGMEWQDELDLNHYDFGARNYDAALGRTFTPDPLGEVFYHLSPYSFLNNNPLNSIDPTGALTLEGQAAIDYFQQLKDEIASKPRKREKEKEEYEDEIRDWVKNMTPDDTDSINFTDNGYDTDGNKVNDKGGNEIDYLYDKEGNEISSTKVTIRGISSGELSKGDFIENPLQEELFEYEKYGVRGWAMASGAITPDNSLFEMYVGGKTLNVGLNYLRKFTGGIKQWVRTGTSYSIEGGFSTYSTRWGAGGNHWKKIGSPTLQNINKSLRQTKLPGTNWRVKDSGHFHWKKK